MVATGQDSEAALDFRYWFFPSVCLLSFQRNQCMLSCTHCSGMILPTSGETREIFYHSGNFHCPRANLTLMILMDRYVMLYFHLLHFHFLISKTGSEVTCLEWSPAYQDLIAVGIGSFDILHTNMPGSCHWNDEVYIADQFSHLDNGQGALVFYTLKNPSWPEMNLSLPSSPF